MAVENIPDVSSIPLSSRWRILKNLTVISLSFVLIFTSYNGLSMLQSTMNHFHGVGTMSQAGVYISFGISSLLFPDYIIKRLGCKSTLLLAAALYLPYIAANFYPMWASLIPSGVLLGFGASILWAAQCTYFNECSFYFCTIDDEESDNDKETATHTASTNTSVDRLSTAATSSSSLEDPTQGSRKVGKASEGYSYRKKVEELNARNLGLTSIDEVSENPITFRCSRADIDKIDVNLGLTSMDEVPKSSITLRCSRDDTDKMDVNLGLTSIDEVPKNSITLSCSHVDTDKTVANREKTEGKKTVTIQEGISYEIKAAPTKSCSRTGSISSCYGDRQRQLSMGSFSTEIQEFYSMLDSTNACFFGCHGLAYYSAQIWSNLMSFYILHPHSIHNETRMDTCSCGADFCNDKLHCVNDDSGKVHSRGRYLLTGINLALGVLAVLLILAFLDSLNRCRNSKNVRFTLDNVLATFNVCKRKEQFVLVPLTMYVGMAQGFYTADITKSYIDCAWGTSHVGLVTVFYGLACALSSTVSGCLVQFTGRIPIFLVGQAVNVANYAFLLVWSPELHHPFMFYLAASMWGVVTGLFWSQLQAFYGVLFQKEEEAAFASYNMYSAFGWTLSFAYSDFICTYIKIYILGAMSSIGIVGYLYSESLYRVKQKQLNAVPS